MIAIIDYGAGNIRSVEKALMHIGCEVEAEWSVAYKNWLVLGKCEFPVLFEEADGVYIKLQG